MELVGKVAGPLTLCRYTHISKGMEPTIGYNATLVLQALTAGHAYGFDVMRVTHLASGTVYPLLRRLEANGLVESAWEDLEEAHDEGRPPRRYYRATADGRKALIAARERIEAQQRLFGHGPVAPPRGGEGGSK